MPLKAPQVQPHTSNASSYPLTRAKNLFECKLQGLNELILHLNGLEEEGLFLSFTDGLYEQLTQLLSAAIRIPNTSRWVHKGLPADGNCGDVWVRLNLS